MNIIPKLITSVALSVCAVICVHADGGKALIVEHQNGGKTAFVLAEKPELTFVNKALRVSVDSKSTDFEISDVKQFYFDDAATDIATLETDDAKIVYQSEDKVIIESGKASASVQLFALNGTRLPERVTTADGRTEISLSSLPKGIYLIKINQQTLKIYRK